MWLRSGSTFPPTARKINEDKLKLDKQLAKEKAAAERGLAEHSAQLQRRVALSKRRAEVAEKVLADFYQARRAFQLIRSPMIWASEMVPEEGVEEDVVTNEGYGVIRRVREYAALFSELEATRFTFGALFGSEATAPYDAITRAHNQIVHAAQDLLRYRHQEDLSDSMRVHMQRMRRVAFGITWAPDGQREVDEIGTMVDAAVAAIESICRPALVSEFVAQPEASGSA